MTVICSRCDTWLDFSRIVEMLIEASGDHFEGPPLIYCQQGLGSHDWIGEDYHWFNRLSRTLTETK